MRTYTSIQACFFRVLFTSMLLCAFGTMANGDEIVRDTTNDPGGPDAGTTNESVGEPPSSLSDYRNRRAQKSTEKTPVSDRKQDQKAILDAVKNENRDDVVALIKKDYALISTVDDELGGQTLVHWAVMGKTPAVLKCLIEWNADLDKQNKNGQTPLNIAVKAKNVEAIRYLLANEAKIKDVTYDELDASGFDDGFDEKKYVVEKSEEVKRRIEEEKRKRLEREKQTENERFEKEKQGQALAAKQKSEEESRRRQELEKLKAELNNPEKLIEPLRELKREDLTPSIDTERHVQLVIYADATQDSNHYAQAKKDFFACLLPNFCKGEDRIGWISDILPSMIQRKDFEGLKECTDGIIVDMVQPKGEYNFNGQANWASHCASLAGFALAMGDTDTAISRIQAGQAVGREILTPDAIVKIAIAIANERMFSRNGSICVEEVPLFSYKGNGNYSRYASDMMTKKLASVNEICWGDDLSLPGPSVTSGDWMSFRYCRVAFWLAVYGKKDEYYKFLSLANKTFKADKLNYAAYQFAMAEAILGDFDRARNHWMQYPTKDTGPWSHVLLSFIVRQEFLAGEFRGWETMQRDKNDIKNLRGTYKDTDMSSYISAFYFDYGRGLARHKTTDEITAEWKTLKTRFDADGKHGQSDFAFFKAGLATGLQDRKNNEKRPKK